MDNYAYQPDDNNGMPFAITRYPPRINQTDNLVEVNSRGKIFKNSTFYKRLSIFLLILALIFLVGLIVIAILYTKSKTKICISNECLRTATNLKFSLDVNVDPCDDFYKYTCGKWQEEHPNHGWFSSFSSFTTISERVAISSLEALTSESSEPDDPQALQKSRDFYKSCMDVDQYRDIQTRFGMLDKILRKEKQFLELQIGWYCFMILELIIAIVLQLYTIYNVTVEVHSITGGPSGQSVPSFVAKQLTYARDLNEEIQLFSQSPNFGATDELGLTSMYQYLQRSNLPIIPSYLSITEKDKAEFTFDWMKSEALIKQIFMMDILFGAVVDANIYNGTENVIYAGQIYQKCPLPSPLRKKKKSGYQKIFNIVKRDSDDDDDIDDEESESMKKVARDINSNIIQYVLKEIFTNNSVELPSDDLLHSAADIIMDISDEIQELVANHTNPDADEEDIFSITINELQSQMENVLPKPKPGIWLKYFNYLFTGTNVTIDPEKDLLYVTKMDLNFLKKMLRYVQGTPEINLELYMWWATVYAMIINTSSDVVEYISKQLNYFASGSFSNVARSRSLECALLVNNYMGYAVSYALADPSFPNTTKPKVERMVEELKNAFVKHVNGINWMDGATKQVTLEKSKEMLTFIGYPDWLFQNGELDKYYADVVIKEDTYLDNMISTIISHNLRKMNSLRTKHKRDWYSEPIEVNAFNSFSDNAINVPMAILTFPMYNLGLEVLNYGSIGAILGHELTHGFDNIGRKHDKYGNYVQWWSNQTIETFENLTECFVKQYDNFTLDGIDGHVKGKNTLGENLADNGGLNQAFSAYKSYVKASGEEYNLPGFENFTSYQLFFIAYGSIWCETASLEDLKDQIEYDEHCPNSIRVVGTLQNSEDFSDAFKCPVGSFMNPKRKCKIW